MLLEKLEMEILAQKQSFWLAEAKFEEQFSSSQEETERLRKKNDSFAETLSKIGVLIQAQSLLLH